MSDSLHLMFKRLLDDVSTKHYRFLYEEFNLDNRLTGLIGARGVGKTTLMLQYIKNHFANDDYQTVFYFSADHIHFNSATIFDYVENLYLHEGITTFFIDEIHKYKNWNQELKNLYDGFPKMKIVFSGSSSIDLVKGAYDLSRRAKLFYLPGLSFREYLNFETNAVYPKIKMDELIKSHHRFDEEIAIIPKIKWHFTHYLKQGFYPFYAEDKLSYHEKLLTIIDKTIYEDIANFYNLKTVNLIYFKKILNFLASIMPGSSSLHNLAKNLGIDDKTVAVYLDQMQETGLLNLIYPAATGNAILRRPEKIFLNNTNLQYAIEGNLSAPVETGTIRELFFIQSVKNARIDIFYDDKADYQIGDHIFEVGGKNKTRAQIKDKANAFLVKDDIFVSKRGEIPLFYFGFLY